MPKQTVESTFRFLTVLAGSACPNLVSEHERPQANMLVEASGRLAA